MAEFGYIKKLRHLVQAFMAALVVYGGYRLYAFVGHFVSGTEYMDRAPLVDGFLPIGALMALKLWVAEGIFDPFHPAALVIFLGAIAVSFVFRKGFCGWLCPVGAVSEAAYRAGARIFGRNFRMPKYLDYPLRSVKYLLLFFFLYVVFGMPAQGILAFLGGAYWKVADVKMLWFFQKMSATTAIVLGGLFLGSLFYRNFWCRYLCPYGALLGIIGLFGPSGIKRDERLCMNCGSCARACPARLPVDTKKAIKSPECTGCLTCVSSCPAKGALRMKTAGGVLHPVLYSALIVAIFFGIVMGAKAAGRWDSAISYGQYRELIPLAEHLDHP